MGILVSVILYLLTILTTFGLVPAVLVALAVLYGQGKLSFRSALPVLRFPAAYIAGGAIGWFFRPFHWNFSFIETLRLQTADHSIEHYAERVLLFVLMTGSVGVWLTGAGMLARSRYRERHAARA